MYARYHIPLSFPAIIFAASLSVGKVNAGQENQINVKIAVVIPPCKINDDKEIVIDFGHSVLTTRIDGHYNKKPINFTLNCGSATSQDLKMSIRGEEAYFDNELLATNQPDLGIAFLAEGNSFPLKSNIDFTISSHPKLEAVLVKSHNGVLDGGDIIASATLTIDYR